LATARRLHVDFRHPFAVVTPTLDGDVLTRLAQAEAAFTPGQLQRILPGRSTEGIRKTLQRLTVQGVVDAEFVGKGAQYRLNRDHLVADHIIAIANQRATLLRRLEGALEGWLVRPVYGAVFGSTARGDARSDSDIDIFLVRPDDAPPDQWEDTVGDLSRSVTRWTGNDTRTLHMPEAEVRSGAGTDPVLTSIVDEGLTVCGHPLWLRQLVRSTRRNRGTHQSV
jgi:Nucleotidyltransferase domain